MASCISVSGLCKDYHSQPVLKSISFDVEQGQIFAFLGPNGAGKSTTMNILSTLLEKSSGKVSINGFSMDYQRRKIQSRIGVVFQNDVLDGDLTVYQNLFYRGGLYLKNSEETRNRISDVLDQLSIRSLAGKKYSACSGGQRRLVQIARALLPNPGLLILDEPTTGLDPTARNTVWQTLLSLRSELNITIFYTTHYMEEALYADRYCILNDGVILKCGTIEKLSEHYGGRLEPALRLNKMYSALLRGEDI